MIIALLGCRPIQKDPGSQFETFKASDSIEMQAMRLLESQPYKSGLEWFDSLISFQDLMQKEGAAESPLRSIQHPMVEELLSHAQEVHQKLASHEIPPDDIRGLRARDSLGREYKERVQESNEPLTYNWLVSYFFRASAVFTPETARPDPERWKEDSVAWAYFKSDLWVEFSGHAELGPRLNDFQRAYCRLECGRVSAAESLIVPIRFEPGVKLFNMLWPYGLGLAELKYEAMTADGRHMEPLGFFEHDENHIITWAYVYATYSTEERLIFRDLFLPKKGKKGSHLNELLRQFYFFLFSHEDYFSIAGYIQAPARIAQKRDSEKPLLRRLLDQLLRVILRRSSPEAKELVRTTFSSWQNRKFEMRMMLFREDWLASLLPPELVPKNAEELQKLDDLAERAFLETMRL